MASSILLLITAACATALRASLDYHRRIQLLANLEEELIRSLGSISKELGESSARGILWQSSPVALTFPTPRDPSGSLLIDHAAGNRLQFQTVLSYRVEGPDQELRRYIDRLPTPHSLAPHPSSLIPPRDDLYFGAPEREFKRIATGVTDFSVTSIKIDDYNENQSVVADPADANLFRLKLRLEQGDDRKYAVSAEIDVVPSN